MMSNENERWSIHKLRCAYKKLGIKYKLVQELRLIRAPGPNHQRLALKDKDILALMRAELSMVRQELVVMVDECVFSKKSFRPFAWSNTN